jgi:hypothetical protein
VGADTRSYAPVFAASEIEALTIAEEITATLAHFPTLEVRVEPVGPADAVMVPAEAELELHGNRPTLHVFNANHTGTACGVEIDTANAVASVDLLALSDGVKCDRCLRIVGLNTD